MEPFKDDLELEPPYAEHVPRDITDPRGAQVEKGLGVKHRIQAHALLVAAEYLDIMGCRRKK